MNVFTDQRIKSISGYGQATYAITYTTKLTLGLRNTAEARDLYSRTELPTKINPATGQHIDSDKWTQYAAASKGVLRMIYKREAHTLLRLEREATQTFSSTLLVSSFEAATMASLAPESRAKIHTARNGVDTKRFSPDFSCENPFGANEIPIVMTGRMDYRPNVDAALWFAQKVLPLIRATLPAEMTIPLCGRSGFSDPLFPE